MRTSRGGTQGAGGEGAPDLVPELFDSRAERAPTSGQSSAALVVGSALLVVELLAAPLVLLVTLVTSIITWWLLDSPWAGRRRHGHRRGINSRLLYLSTLMLLGLWLAVMFIFRASDPALSSGFTTTLPLMIWGVDVSLLQRLNGMETLAQPQGALPIGDGGEGFAPFSLFVHGTASTVSISLLAYAMSSARRRLRRRLRERGILAPREPRHPNVPPTVR